MISGIIHNALAGGSSSSSIIIPDKLKAIAGGDFSKTLVTVDAGNYTFKVNLFYCDGETWVPLTRPEFKILPGYTGELNSRGELLDVSEIKRSRNKGVEYWLVCYKGSTPLYAQYFGTICSYTDTADWVIIYPEDGNPESNVYPFWTDQYDINWGAVSGGGGGITWRTLGNENKIFCDGFRISMIGCGGAYTHNRWSYVPNADAHKVGKVEISESTTDGFSSSLTDIDIYTNMSAIAEDFTVKALGIDWVSELNTMRWSIATYLGLEAKKGKQRQWLN